MVTAARHWIAMVGCALFALSGAPAEAKTDGQERVVERARLALDRFSTIPISTICACTSRTPMPFWLCPDARRAGSSSGQNMGSASFWCATRRPATGASRRSTRCTAAVSGVQAGGIMSDMVSPIMNEGAVDKLIAHKVQFGGDVGLAFGRMGVGVGAGRPHSRRGRTRSPRARGLYGGMALEGTVVSPKHDWNGRTTDARSIPRRSCARLRAAAPTSPPCASH